MQCRDWASFPLFSCITGSAMLLSSGIWLGLPAIDGMNRECILYHDPELFVKIKIRSFAGRGFVM